MPRHIRNRRVRPSAELRCAARGVQSQREVRPALLPWFEKHDRDRAPAGVASVELEVRERGNELRPQPFSFEIRRDTGVHRPRSGTDLNAGVRGGDKVVEPRGMVRLPRFGCGDRNRIAVRHVDQRRCPPHTALRADMIEQQQTRIGPAGKVPANPALRPPVQKHMSSGRAPTGIDPVPIGKPPTGGDESGPQRHSASRPRQTRRRNVAPPTSRTFSATKPGVSNGESRCGNAQRVREQRQ